MNKKSIVISTLDGPEDLLLSVPCLRAIQKTHADSEIYLLISVLCEELIDLLPSGLTVMTTEDAESASIDAISRPETYYQLGTSEQSLALSARIKANTSIGAHYSAGELIAKNDWDIYSSEVTKCIRYNPFHRVELLRNRANHIGIESDFELHSPLDLQANIQKFFTEPHIKIGIAVEGQNADELRAILESVLVLDLRLQVYLLGTVKDRRLSSTLVESLPNKNRVVELTGRLSLRETAAFAQACDIVISVPGIVSTMAAGFGTFCIALDSSQGENFIHYPYGHGHLIVQRNAEKLDVQEFGHCVADLVAHTVLGDNGNIPSQANWQQYFDTRLDSLIGKLRVFITQRVQEELSDGATRTDLKLYPLLFTGATADDCLRTFYRLLWEQTLNGFTLATNDLEVLETSSLSTLASLLAPMEQLCELLLFGQKYTSLISGNIAQNDVNTAKVNSNRLQELDDLIRIFSNTHPYLAPICQFLFAKHGQSRSTTIPEIAAELASAYRGAQLQVLILLDLYKSLFQNTYDQETRSYHG